MVKRNYQKEMEEVIKKEEREGHVPTLLLHSCCAPCSSAVLEKLMDYFRITILYYNPNISPKEEYEKRVKELKHLLGEIPQKYPVSLIEGEYEPEQFYDAVRGLEDIPEGGERCFACYRLRLEEAAEYAARLGSDYFTTTLTISPLKNTAKLNEIGEELAEKYGVKCLPSDFKKKEGYKRSIELSAQYGLYRQDFCGCEFSKKEAEARRERKKNG
jgi:epoxyqueuosine reductase